MNKTSVKTFIKQIIEADVKQVECQFRIANLLTAIRDHKLYKDAGYNNFHMMIRGEFDFSTSTASRYCSLYESYEYLGYKEPEFTRLMTQFGWSRLQKFLSNSEKKLGYRALKKMEDEYNNTARGRQFHFELDDKAAAATFEQYLTQHGMVTTKAGRRTGVTSSLEALVNDYDRLKKSEFKSGTQSVRKAS